MLRQRREQSDVFTNSSVPLPGQLQVSVAHCIVAHCPARFVHRSCLDQWRAQSASAFVRCHECKFEYRLRHDAKEGPEGQRRKLKPLVGCREMVQDQIPVIRRSGPWAGGARGARCTGASSVVDLHYR